MMKYTSRLEGNVRSSYGIDYPSRNTYFSANDRETVSSSSTAVGIRSSPVDDSYIFQISTNIGNSNSNSNLCYDMSKSGVSPGAENDRGTFLSDGKNSVSSSPISSNFDPNSPLFVPKGFSTYQPSLRISSSSTSSVASLSTLGPSNSLYSNVVSLSSPYHQANRKQTQCFNGHHSMFNTGSVLTASAASFQPGMGVSGQVLGEGSSVACECVFNGNVRNANVHPTVSYSDGGAAGVHRSLAFSSEYNPRFTTVSSVGPSASNNSSRRSSNIDSAISTCIHQSVRGKVYTAASEHSTVVSQRNHGYSPLCRPSNTETDEEDDEGFDAFLNGALKEVRGSFEEDEEEKRSEKDTPFGLVEKAYKDGEMTVSDSVISESTISQLIVSLTGHVPHAKGIDGECPNTSSSNPLEIKHRLQHKSLTHQHSVHGPRAIGTTSPLGTQRMSSDCSRPVISDCLDNINNNINDQQELDEEHKSPSLAIPNIEESQEDCNVINEAWINHRRIGLSSDVSVSPGNCTSDCSVSTLSPFFNRQSGNMLHPENDPVLVVQKGHNNSPKIQGDVSAPFGSNNNQSLSNERCSESVIGRQLSTNTSLKLSTTSSPLDPLIDLKSQTYTQMHPETSIIHTSPSQPTISSKCVSNNSVSNTSLSQDAGNNSCDNNSISTNVSRTAPLCSTTKNTSISANDLPSLEDLLLSHNGADGSKKHHISKEKSTCKKAIKAAKPPPAIDDYPTAATLVSSTAKKSPINKWTSNIQTTEAKCAASGQLNTKPSTVGLTSCSGIQSVILPAKKGDVLVYLKDYPETARHIKIIAYSYQHKDDLNKLKTLWMDNGVPFPGDNFAAHYLFIRHKNKVELCMKYNGKVGKVSCGAGRCDSEANKTVNVTTTTPSAGQGCLFQHRCLFCGKGDHGWFDKGMCTRHRAFETELKKLALNTELIGLLATAYNRE